MQKQPEFPKGVEPYADGNRLLKKADAAARLSVSTRTFDRLVARGVIERVFVGASRRYRLSEIERIVSQGA